MKSYLNSDCWKKEEGYCKDPDCKDAVKQAPTGNWFITMGHAGFNSKANNGNGYKSKQLALRSMNFYLNKSYYKGMK